MDCCLFCFTDYEPQQRSLTPRLRLWLITAIALLLQVFCPLAAQAQTWYDYGIDGSMTDQEAVTVEGLVTPGSIPDESGTYHFAQRQSRYAITSRLGYARYESEEASRYVRGSGYADIVYDSDGYAVGVRQYQ